MVKKQERTAARKKGGGLLGSEFAATVKGSAQQIWLAGLGAFAKAQEEGTKVFEGLVKEGTAIQRKTQSAAEEKITEVTHKMTSMAGDFTAKAGQQWDKLEQIFEARVAKALNKLGVPSHQDIEALIARIDELNESVAKLSGGKPAAKSARKAAAAAPKTARKAAPGTAPRSAAKRSTRQRPA